VRRIELREYSEKVVDLDVPELDAIGAAAAGRLTIRRLPGGSHAVSSGPHVGVLVAGDVQVVVQPKVGLYNLFLMLGVGSPTFAAEPALFRRDDDLLDAMVGVFAAAVERATQRGVLRGYRRIEERLISPRGRIDVTAQMRRPATPSPVSCSFDEFTADVTENRALLAALERLLRLPGLVAGQRARLAHLAHRFEEVLPTVVDPVVLDRWRPNRLNQHYEVPLRLAAVILRNVTLRQPISESHNDEVTAPSFMVNMNDLFQDFVADRLRRALHGHLSVETEPKVHLAVHGRLAMKPDLVFRMNGRRRREPAVYVGDVKYKLSSGPARMSDYYQLLAYTTALEVDEGVLIYAQYPDPTATVLSGDDEIDDELGDEAVHTVQIVNTDKLLHVYRLPLAGPNESVEEGLRRLARWLLSRGAAASTAHTLVRFTG
jgi:5-methylcytosine-specific restriction enzyme subunit McrC